MYYFYFQVTDSSQFQSMITLTKDVWLQNRIANLIKIFKTLTHQISHWIYAPIYSLIIIHLFIYLINWLVFKTPIIEWRSIFRVWVHRPMTAISLHVIQVVHVYVILQIWKLLDAKPAHLGVCAEIRLLHIPCYSLVT